MGPFLAILVALTVALMLERALRLIHELAATGADIGYFFPLLVQLLPYYLELAIPARVHGRAGAPGRPAR